MHIHAGKDGVYAQYTAIVVAADCNLQCSRVSCITLLVYILCTHAMTKKSSRRFTEKASKKEKVHEETGDVNIGRRFACMLPDACACMLTARQPIDRALRY